MIVHLWTDPTRVRQELLETEEYLVGRSGRGVNSLRKTLASVIEVAAVEIGLSQLEDMGLVIGGQIAEHLASVGAGPLLDVNEEWWVIRRGVLLGRT